MSRPTKRKAGRPKGTTKIPPDYYLVLRDLLDEYGPVEIGPYKFFGLMGYGRPVSKMCRNIMTEKVIANGGVRLIDRRTGKIVAKIVNDRTLRSRLYEAWRRAQQRYKVHNAKITWTTISATNHNSNRIDSNLMARADLIVTGKFGNQRDTILRIGKKLHK